MAAAKTSISVGYAIHGLLTASEEVAARVTKVFPIAVDNATLPYVVYRPVGMEQTQTKTGDLNDTCTVEVVCCAADYPGAVELAEAVRSALDGKEGESSGLYMRDCTLSDMEHDWRDDAYVIILTFTIKI